MRIGIFAKADDRQAKMVLARINQLRPRAACLFDTSLDGKVTVAIDGNRLVWGRGRLDRLDAAYIHGFRYEDPVVPRPADLADWSLWQASYVAEQQRYSFLFSFFSRLEAAGVPMHNGIGVYLSAYAKHAQLQTLRRNGIPVPEVLCTNERRAADSFCRVHDRTVWRTSTGRCAWQLFRKKQKDFLIEASKPPILLAPIVPGPLRRAYVFGGRTLACYEHRAPDREGVEDLERFQAVVPAHHEKVLADAARVTRASWFVAQVVDSADGPVVYDVDPDPVLTDLPNEIANFLVDQLARGLLGMRIRKGLVPARGKSSTPRESLFSRRMIRVLFDIEASKYKDS